MSKPKKRPPATKFVDSVLSELKDEEGKSQITSSEQRDLLLNKFRPPKEGKAKDESVLHIQSMDEGTTNEPPAGLVPEKTKIAPFSIEEPPVPPPPPVSAEKKSEVSRPEAPQAAKPLRDDSVTVPLPSAQKNDSTFSLGGSDTNQGSLSDNTQPLKSKQGRPFSDSVKVSYGSPRSSRGNPSSATGQASDMQLGQAENLKLAQARITELEKELERLRNENELLSSAGSIARQRIEELTEKIHQVERARVDAIERAEMEMKVVRDGLSDKSRELNKAKKKIEELESRMQTDVRKIRVRERELENRLELARLEKTALVRSKDETILDLKRNLDLLNMELESYKQKASELQSKIDEQQEQLGRTVRALRLALTNLESSDSTSGQVVPIKKAE